MTGDEKSARPERGRIVIAASSFADASSGVRLAALLSSRIEAEIQGVFVEEESSILFRSPAARIVSTTGALLDLPSPDEMRAALKRDALAFEGEIARLAREHARSWSFRTVQGRLLAHLGEVLRASDILLLGHRALYRLRGPVIRLGRGPRMEIAASLAADLGVSVMDIDLPDVGGNGQAGAFAEILSLVGHTSATAIVADIVSGPVRTPEQIEALLEAARCPVILVGDSGSGGG
ncbi:MAG: hypothetical protein Kow0026_16180 [Oricola sp.]